MDDNLGRTSKWASLRVAVDVGSLLSARRSQSDSSIASQPVQIKSPSFHIPRNMGISKFHMKCVDTNVDTSVEDYLAAGEDLVAEQYFSSIKRGAVII